MAVAAAVRFVQGLNIGAPAQALFGTLVDGVVTVSNGNDTGVVRWVFEVLDVPPGSAVPTGVVQDGGISTWTFTPDIRGGYLVQLTVYAAGDSAQARDARTFGVKLASGRFIPSFCPRTQVGDDVVNFAGQLRGWSPYLEEWLLFLDNLAGAITYGLDLDPLSSNGNQIVVALSGSLNIVRVRGGSTAIAFDTDPASIGRIRFPNNQLVAAARNALNTDDLPLLATNASNEEIVGDDVTIPAVRIRAATEVAHYSGGTQRFVSDSNGVHAISPAKFVFGAGANVNASSGAGAPVSLEPNGSVYFRTNGAGGADGIYTRQGGLWYPVGGGSLTGSPPVNVTKAAAAVGVAADAARADHKHDVDTAAPVDVVTANAEGVSTSLARADHAHNLPFATVQTVLAGATGSISVNNQKITNLATPTAGTDAVNKAYVDALSGTGIDVKSSVRVLSTGVIVLSGAQVIDGVAVVAGDRVLVVGQGGAPPTADIDNGIYDVVDPGAWTRSADLATGSSAAATYCFIQEGTTYGDTGWICVTNAPNDVVDTDPLGYSQFTASESIVAGDGLVRSGTILDVVANADGSIVVNANDVQVGVLASDAQHGVRGGGTQHALVVPAGAAGFMSGADKSKLDGIASGAAALTASAPSTILPDDSAMVGVATDAARADHKHAIAADTPGNVGIGDVAAEGVSTSFARADHTHGFPSPGAPVNVTKSAASAGAAATVARSDHKHDVSTAAPSGSIAIGNINTEGVAITLARSDHTHQVTAPPPPASVSVASNSPGVSTFVARADHLHNVPTAIAVDITDASNSVGAAGTFSRSDHQHAHGNRGGGTLHAVATGALAGFMSAADKSKLDGITAGANPSVWVFSKFAEVGADVTKSDDTPADLLTLNITVGTSCALAIWASVGCSNTGASTINLFRVLVDGVFVRGAGTSAAGASDPQGVNIVYRKNVAAGAHTVKIQWSTSGGTLRVRPITASSTEYATLLVAQVDTT